MKPIRPCDYAPPGAPCPTHDSGTWPDDCVCYWRTYEEAREVEKRFLTYLTVFACLLVAIVLVLFATVARASPSCPTLREARRAFPDAHLWRDRDDCWGNRRSPHHRHREPPPDAHGNKIKVVDWDEFNAIDAQADNKSVFDPWETRIGGVFKQ